MKSVWHALSHNKSSQRPAHWLYLAVETYPVDLGGGVTEHRLGAAAAVYHRWPRPRNPERVEWWPGAATTPLWDWIISHARPGRRLNLVALNLRKTVALTGGFSALAEAGWEARVLISGGTCELYKHVRGRATIRMADARNLWREGGEQMILSLGFNPSPVMETGGDEAERTDRARLICDALQMLMERYREFLDVHNCGTLALTVAAQASNAYRHRWMDHKIVIHADPEAVELERDGYHGGRCQCYRVGRRWMGHWYALDVNSMYPYVMREHSYPTRLVRYRRAPSMDALRLALDRYQVIADVLLYAEEDAYPKRHESRLIYPLGRYRTVLPDPELRYAMAAGHVVECSAFSAYEPAPIFRRYVDYWYALRLRYRAAGEMANAEFCKLLLNSLYGKFGAKGHEVTVTGTCDLNYLSHREVYDMLGDHWVEQCIAGVQREIRETERGHNAFVAIAAMVTSHARLYLYRLMEAAGREHVWYCDTDMLIVDPEGYGRLIEQLDPVRLGALRVQSEFAMLSLLQQHNYVAGTTIKHAGIPRDARLIGEDMYLFSAEPGLGTMARNNEMGMWRTRETVRRLGDVYDYGVILPGGRTTPIVLSED